MSAKITKALHEVMSKVSYVQKGQTNAFHKYKYAGEADLLAVLRPAMMDAGLLLIPSAVSQSPIDSYGNTQVVMEYTLAHKDGDVWPHPIRALGCGNDTNKNGVGDKGTYKAITGANKYLLFKLFQIETGDDPESGEHDGSLGNGKGRDEMDVAASWKAWATAAGTKNECSDWMAKAKADIQAMVSIEDLDRFTSMETLGAKQLRALHDHHEKRYDAIMKVINDKRDELRAKMAA